MTHQVKASTHFKRLCTEFGEILGGESSIEPGPVVLLHG